MELTEDDVLEILKLFEQSKFDFLQLQEGERKITVSKGGFVPAGADTAPPPAPCRRACCSSAASGAPAGCTRTIAAPGENRSCAR